MEFNIRALCAAQSVDISTRTTACEVAGKQFEFRSGISVRVKMPDDLGDFCGNPDCERILCVLASWIRVYKYRTPTGWNLHCLALFEGEDQSIEFGRLDMWQPLPASRKGLQEPVTLLGGEMMSYERCLGWLVSLQSKWLSISSPDKTALQNPRLQRPRQARIAFVGIDHHDGVSLQNLVSSFGAVYGGETIYISPASFTDTRARLASKMPFDAVIVLRLQASNLNADIVPTKISPQLVHVCTSSTGPEIAEELKACIELFVGEFHVQLQGSVSEDDLLLSLMLRGMIAHSKIGQFKHCLKEQVLTGVRARRLNVPRAAEILADNCDTFSDKTESSKFFLSKSHNEGSQYFLNPRVVAEIKNFLDRQASA